MRKGKNIKVGIALALLFLVVGFAAVSATLNISGSVLFKGNKDEFNANLRFVGDDDENKAATITSSTDKTGGTVEVIDAGKTLSFTTPVMDTVNETVTVTYYVENHGQYDAEFKTISCIKKAEDNTELVEYIEVLPSKNYNGMVLGAATEAGPTQAKNSDSIVVKLKKPYASETQASVTIECTLTADAVEKDETTDDSGNGE